MATVITVDGELALVDEGVPSSCVYVDSPMPNSIDQILPFFRDGFFDSARTPVFVGRRLLRGPGIGSRTGLMDVRRILASKEAGRLPVSRGGIVFYPFNARSNIAMVSNRHLSHVLILHGESNKVSSYRPAARLYDYVAVAGELACRRYVRSRIFTRQEVDGGRLVRMGDTFVQSMPYLVGATAGDAGWLLYAPTWENTTQDENYSSAEGGYGFSLVRRYAEELRLRRILFKIHPNFGLINPGYVWRLIAELRRFRRDGYEVEVVDDGLNGLVRYALRVFIGREVLAGTDQVFPIALATVDVSGMEAICLKQHLPHVVVTKRNSAGIIDDPELADIYRTKAVGFTMPPDQAARKLVSYLDDFSQTDDEHRSLVFSFSDQSLQSATASQRHAWLRGYVNRNPYWSMEPDP